MKEKLLISACLCGTNCKYNGSNNKLSNLDILENKYELIKICPEVMGNLGVPRKPCEINHNKVITNDGIDLTNNFVIGANEALMKCKEHGCTKALLKNGSPSCGSTLIYDGTFSGNKINGMGITANLLKSNGIELYSEEDIMIL